MAKFGLFVPRGLEYTVLMTHKFILLKKGALCAYSMKQKMTNMRESSDSELSESHCHT